MADDEQPLIDLYRCVCLVTDTMLPLPLVEFLYVFFHFVCKGVFAKLEFIGLQNS